ncbi:hypothetical protein A2634_00310 [Candidatus Amesbacteria bacterium RIFCSPHIGHO2_01_FULL_48_32]|uniref:Peptidase A2 domain-containing protein n=1 Tax=Candidatus Amesbacteria bacterium RIFCSPLOWO2_01_FULL_48_25 TaxID=1797259 RepID=A0A1F4ZAS5_9BACT|nr:MAG: hypothetical protein A2634_00310 [Candidatus Amesbacteria bacterium RIFCSPHIGHO2_01_FULL_48_32]OGD03251.1 MAG: hypothetical protein A2989_00260 [Candidatus Amesbacteria bacterium RIFCSPLOWO2_01_FULL_48_25]HJZ05197.1 retropepsin-like aspartic protease [Patescibacteria group bacterium]
MPIFPYQYKRIDFGRVFNPLVLLPVKASWGWQNLWFLVDSGADTTTIPLALAKNLGIQVQNNPTKLHGIGSQAVDAFPGKIMLKIGESEFTARSYFVEAEKSTLLLGRMDIFDRFSVLFDKTGQRVTFS